MKRPGHLWRPAGHAPPRPPAAAPSGPASGAGAAPATVRAGIAAIGRPSRAARRGAAGATMAATVAVTFAACAVPAIPAHAAEPPPLGRLFNTPQQRMQLDAQRYGTAQSAPPADSAPAAPAPPPLSPPSAPPSLVVNGVVRPAHGKPTVWLNQEPVRDGQRIVRADGKVTLVLPSGQRITLKPGQRYDEATGEVRDANE